MRTAHWAEIKALNRRVVLDIDNGEYKDLKPVADFVARLSELITKFLDRPIRWKPAVPSEAEADEALARVQREVFGRLHAFVDEKILRIPRQQWMEAFEYQGPGSTFRRAKVIQTIYDFIRACARTRARYNVRAIFESGQSPCPWCHWRGRRRAGQRRTSFGDAHSRCQADDFVISAGRRTS